MKRRILLVDDDVAILLTMKAVLEISGFNVDTAASAKEARGKIRSREYHMVISDMRMESDAAGAEVIQAARSAPYHPAVALLTAFPVDEDGWDGVAPDKIFVKATHTRVLLQQIEKLFAAHAAKLAKLSTQVAGTGKPESAEALAEALPVDAPLADGMLPAAENGGKKTRPGKKLANA